MGEMIAVTKLNGKRFVVNAEMIRYIESTPDTMITLSTGDKVIVQESIDAIVQLTIEYKRQLNILST